jgi:hypothetical protein
MAEVVDFPGTPSHEAEFETVAEPEVVEAEVVEGVVVDDAPILAPVPLRVVQVVRVVVQHDHTKTAGRHLAYIPLGAAVVVKRLWDSRTTSPYERFMRAGSYFVNVVASALVPGNSGTITGGVAGTLEVDVSMG